MPYKLLFLLLSVSFLYGSYDYDIHMKFKRGPTPEDQRNEFIVNGAPVFCPCGKTPIGALFLYGRPEYFCTSHVPEIEYVKPIGPHQIDELLRSIGADMNINGAHCGMEENGK